MVYIRSVSKHVNKQITSSTILGPFKISICSFKLNVKYTILFWFNSDLALNCLLFIRFADEQMYHWILLNMWIDAFLTRISSKFLSRTSFWQSYHSLPSYTWFEPILTPLWSCYLVWTILTNKLILIFVLRDGLKFFLTIISFTAILLVVLTPLWSSYLVWTILTNKLILIYVLQGIS